MLPRTSTRHAGLMENLGLIVGGGTLAALISAELLFVTWLM